MKLSLNLVVEVGWIVICGLHILNRLSIVSFQRLTAEENPDSLIGKLISLRPRGYQSLNMSLNHGDLIYFLGKQIAIKIS